MTWESHSESAGPEGATRIRPYLADPASLPPAPTTADPSGSAPGGADPGWSEPGGADPGVAVLRPFVLTAGRVPGEEYNFEVETQVTTRPSYAEAPGTGLTRELAAIVALCAEPMSVAEISAALHLHLGVTKVLVGDLHAAGYVDVYSFDIAGSVDSDLILRVMRGLRAIA